ncbi:18682_t:CDS:2 [Dentiscutata erythropus]|uniref:18682_t:CDS:1 n=1 Tax=Dentiscutata erythropus TaxID=1348616 RepID=A0A9N9BAX0_9GLOM|nr:18682_t:CDS:2 [Dentiscutata erythropus]
MYSKRKTRYLKTHNVVDSSSTKPKSSCNPGKSNHSSQISSALSPVVSNSNKLTTTPTKNHQSIKKPSQVVFQIGYIPLEESPYERIVYVWLVINKNLGDTFFSTQDISSAVGGLDGILFDNGNGDNKLSSNIIVARSTVVDEVDSKLYYDVSTKLVISDVSEILSKSPWPEKIPFFPSQYLYITEEILEEKPDPNLKKYESYLNVSLDNNEGDSFDWIGENLVCQEFDGQSLLYNQSDPTASLLLSPPHGSVKQPKCSKCGSKRVFEFQLMPNMLCILPTGEYAANSSEKKSGIEGSKCGIAQFDVGIEWGTVMIFKCQEDCEIYNVSKDEVSELILVQYEL